MPALTIAYFGLPLAACLLAARGFEIAMATLPPVPGPGERRLRRLIGSQRVRRVGPRRDAPEAWQGIEARLIELGCDVLVSFFWTRALPARLLDRVPLALGVHPSLLPRHRGPDPYYWSIDAGDEYSGVTVHLLEAGYDTGAIVAQERLPIGERNAWQLARALDRPALRQLFRALDELRAGRPLPRREQSEAQASFARAPMGDELRVDWSWPTERVLRRVRALSPVPGLALDVMGVEFFAECCRATRDYPRALLPGEAALRAGAEPRCVIRTVDGAVSVERARTLVPRTRRNTPPLGAADTGSSPLNEVLLDGARLARLLAARRAAPGYLGLDGC
jgi:methionyl-tRNA formyltransferase